MDLWRAIFAAVADRFAVAEIKSDVTVRLTTLEFLRRPHDDGSFAWFLYRFPSVAFKVGDGTGYRGVEFSDEAENLKDGAHKKCTAEVAVTQYLDLFAVDIIVELSE